MSAATPTILATSGGYRLGNRIPLEFNKLIQYAVELAGVEGRAPKLCHIGTAMGDQDAFHARFDAAGRHAGFGTSHLNLFPMPPVTDIRGFLLDQDVIWVNGGSVANLLAVWRVHGLGEILHEVWQSGIVLAGVSAGSICWHTGGATDSFGPELRVVTDGLGFLPYGNGVHYDTEELRRPTVQRAVGSGQLPLTYCTDDGAGLLYRGTELAEAVSERAGGGAYVVRTDGSGAVTEDALTVRRL
ncbi:peptidase E [Sciscionella marina]|uniref:Type 1 glutamine amidotransferase-like domain-containing protein n=1 Tax=Sciscionella marina TaxID=508770 RepID=UPI0003670FE9|nr:peptidase E [Sciscionella marina]